MAASNNPNTSLKVATPDEFRDDANHWVGKLNAIAQDPAKMTQSGEIPWSTGFFDCFSPGDLCLKTFCCPCITFGQTHHRINKDPNLNGYSCCNLACCAWCVAAHCGIHCIPNLIQRNDIKERGNLTGNFFIDCLKDKEAEHLLSRNNVIMDQPGKVNEMNYGAPQKVEGMDHGAAPYQAMAYPQQQQPVH
ncbi:MAG: hypothetical protein LQ340_003500 [Diploschistes diacapsis]|nr:MAG: hypothetical protein LQ340_003500 [Diploschistes diacapsis]